jgi:hypothetical protein
MNADAEFDALVWRDLGVALDHRPLNFDGAVHRVDDAAEFNDAWRFAPTIPTRI